MFAAVLFFSLKILSDYVIFSVAEFHSGKKQQGKIK
jgi:hypothetical protein